MLNNKGLNIHIVSTFLCITLQSSPTRTSENGTFLRIEYKCIKHVKGPLRSENNNPSDR